MISGFTRCGKIARQLSLRLVKIGHRGRLFFDRFPEIHFSSPVRIVRNAKNGWIDGQAESVVPMAVKPDSAILNIMDSKHKYFAIYQHLNHCIRRVDTFLRKIENRLFTVAERYN